MEQQSIFKHNYYTRLSSMTQQKSSLFSFGKISIALGILALVSSVFFWRPIKAMYFTCARHPGKPFRLHSNRLHVRRCGPHS